MYQRASVELDAYLRGKIPESKLSKAVLSCSAFPIYQIADTITRLPTLEQRRIAFAEMPEYLKERIHAEVLRLWERRKVIE